MLKFHSWLFLKIFPIIILAAAVVSAFLIYILPAPPTVITTATSQVGGGYEFLGLRYREALARSGVRLDIRYTGGSVENIKLLEDGKSGVKIGFTQGGISNSQLTPNVRSLGRVNYQPFWIFYRETQKFEKLQQFKGKRIAVGAVGSGTQVAAGQLFALAGVNPDTATFSPLGGQPAVDALLSGRVDAAFLAYSPNAPIIKALLSDSSLRLMNIEDSEALTRLLPYLVQLRLPRSSIDYERNIPPVDINLVGTTNAVIVRNDLHPQVVLLLAQTLLAEHRKSGIFERPNEFPWPTDPEFSMNDGAADFYKNGNSVLYGHLPYWMLVHVQRAIAVSLAGLAILIPVFNYFPRTYRWLMRERLRFWYRRLRTIEARLQLALLDEQISVLEADLEAIDREINKIGVPLRFSDLFFSLKIHINLVRTRLTARRAELRIKAPADPSTTTSVKTAAAEVRRGAS